MMKIAKRFSALFCAIMLVVCASVPVFAESTNKLIDEADLFTSTEDSEIEQRLEDASYETGWDMVVYTNYNGVSSGEIEYFCDDYYEDNGFGLGYEYSGVMLTIDMSSREMFILTKGDAQYYFDDARVDAILDDVVDYLSSGDYYGAADAFIQETTDYYYDGMPDDGSYENIEYDNDYDNDYDNRSIGESFLYVLKEYGIIIAVVAVAVGVLSVVFTFLRYKNHGKKDTYDLRSNSSTKLYEKEDVFLHKSVSVTTISSSSGGSGGRSSGGGGSSHGGGGRSF